MALWTSTAMAAEDEGDQFLGLSNAQLAIAVAVVVTTARVAFVAITGGTLLGRSLGGALLVVYLGHVVAEGVIYGAGAGASAYVLSARSGDSAEAEPPPSIDPNRLRSAEPPVERLPLETAKRHLP
jgi:hypothetical protein